METLCCFVGMHRSNFRTHSGEQAENIAYRTNQLPPRAQDFAPTTCNPTIRTHFFATTIFRLRRSRGYYTLHDSVVTSNLLHSLHSLILFNSYKKRKRRVLQSFDAERSLDASSTSPHPRVFHFFTDVAANSVLQPLESEISEVFPEVRQQAVLPISRPEVQPAAQVVQPEPL